MGFCYFNNVAIAIRYLQEKYHSLRRIFLLDWDTHAFNGTMDVFYDDPSVLNVSIHQDPTSFYPGTGFAGQTGEGKGTGYTVNIPLHPGAGDDDYLFVMNNLIIPLIDSYKPQMIVISSGIDSHKFDPISDMQLTERGYGIMTSLLMRKAEDYSEGRLFVELEGGYNLNSLARSNYEILRSLLGERKLIYPLFQEDNVMESTEHTMDSLKHIFGNYHDI